MSCLRDLLTNEQIEMLYEKFGGVEWTNNDKIIFLEEVNEIVNSDYIAKVIKVLKTPIVSGTFPTSPSTGHSYYESDLYKLMLTM